jgi:REP element-mobilizing transposase RayT
VILGYHFIFSAYGFWLPNDPRGSWSDTIRQLDLLQFGPATKVTTARNLAHDEHDRTLRFQAKRALLHKPVRFTGIQARAIYRGFLVAQEEAGYEVCALSIMPDHVHLVMHAHPRGADLIARHLKSKATRQLTREGLHPFAQDTRKDGTHPSSWARKHWCPFIDTREYFERAIEYVRQNPIRAGLREQSWNLT